MIRTEDISDTDLETVIQSIYQHYRKIRYATATLPLMLERERISVVTLDEGWLAFKGAS